MTSRRYPAAAALALAAAAFAVTASAPARGAAPASPRVNRDEVFTPSFRAEINGGVAVGGCGVRAAGPPLARGTIVLGGLPADATVLHAVLNWTVLDAAPPSPTIVFHEASAPPATATGRSLGSDTSPCWGIPDIYGFSADVTAAMTATGAGTYLFELPDSGDVAIAPSPEGAALIVVFCSPSSPRTDVVVYEGLESQISSPTAPGDTVQTITGFDASSPVRAAQATFVVSDGQNAMRMANSALVEGVEVIPEFDGDEGLCAAPAGVFYDVDTVDVSGIVPGGAGSIQATVIARGDCLTWSAFALAVSTDTVDNAAFGCPAPSCPVPPQADAGPDVTICEGATAHLDAGLSIACDASGLTYQWSDGLMTVCTTAVCDVSPNVTRAYTLEVHCQGSPACTDTASVTVTVVSDSLPGDAGNTLRSVRSAGDVVMSWGAVPGSATYVLHRGQTKGVWPPPPLRSGLASPADTEPDVPGPPLLYFYRSAGVSCGGREGP